MRFFKYVIPIYLLIISCNSSTKISTLVKNEADIVLTQKLNEISQQADFNGFGVAIVNENGVLYQNGFGIANIETLQKYNENTVQNIASVSKTFIGIAILKAQELGKLNLDDPINNYLPFKVINPYFPDVPITIRQLATHTSSIIDSKEYLNRNIVLKDTTNLDENLKINIDPTRFNPPSAIFSIEEFLRNILCENGVWYLKEGFSENKPGSIYDYSNTGATLAALVVERATGIPYDKFTSQYILEPLGMSASGWKFSAINFSDYTHTFQNKSTPYPFYFLNTYPDGGLLTTSKDMSKFINELLKGYLGNGTLLSKESYREYFTPQLCADNFIDRATSEYSDEYNMGITIGFGATYNFGHYGGDPGLFSMIYFDKTSKTGRYYISNTDGGEETAKFQKGIMDLIDEYLLKVKSIKKIN